MEFETILFERRGSVGLITLNRPQTLNALSLAMMKEMRRAIDACVADPAIGAIVLTGMGRAYCAGADISAFRRLAERGNRDEAEADEANFHYLGPENWTSYVQQLPKPTIAAVNGIAVGLGVTHILPLDIRIASDQAQFGMFFIKMGLVPELAASALLPRLVGVGRALEWCLTGRLISAQEAREAGLVSEVVPADSLLRRALELGEQLANTSAPAIVAIRELIRQNVTEDDVHVVLQREAKALGRMYRTPEHKEAIAAFLEKRSPIFRRQ